MATSTRGPALTACALLFALLALSSFAKPLEIGPTPGFVLLGRRLSGATALSPAAAIESLAASAVPGRGLTRRRAGAQRDGHGRRVGLYAFPADFHASR
jgi:hypothetical protein